MPSRYIRWLDKPLVLSDICFANATNTVCENLNIDLEWLLYNSTVQCSETTSPCNCSQLHFVLYFLADRLGLDSPPNPWMRLTAGFTSHTTDGINTTHWIHKPVSPDYYIHLAHLHRNHKMAQNESHGTKLAWEILSDKASVLKVHPLVNLLSMRTV